MGNHTKASIYCNNEIINAVKQEAVTDSNVAKQECKLDLSKRMDSSIKFIA